MALFGKANVSEFENNPHVRDKLGTYKILNSDELIDYLMDGLFEQLHKMYSNKKDVDKISSEILTRLTDQLIDKN